MARVPVLLNRGGGAVAANPEIADKVRDALAGAGIDAEIELVTGGECSVRCRAVAERGDPLLVVGGGDGTISAAASAIVGTETRLGILPLGTLNHFARDLGIPTDLDEAAKLIAADSDRRVDVAEMNGRIFINNSAIGLYPLMVIDRDLQRKRFGRSKKLAMIVASFRTLARFGHQRLTLTVNDEKERIETPLLFVGNTD
jgi:diacylglycerol kinase family enzyme